MNKNVDEIYKRLIDFLSDEKTKRQLGIYIFFISIAEIVSSILRDENE
ncbi:MAG: hypothetical protein QXY65_06685 [Candidatus Methanomethylicaceae archaeon]